MRKQKKSLVSGSSLDVNGQINERGQRKMTRLVQADRKATVTDINTHHNSAMNMKTSKCRTCQTLNWMGYNRKRSRWVQLLSAKNREIEAIWTQAYQNVGKCSSLKCLLSHDGSTNMIPI